MLPVVLDEVGRLAEPELHGLVQPLVIPLLRGRRRFGADDELDPHLLDGGGSICLLELLQVAHALILAVGVAEVERHLLLDLELLAQRRPQGRQAVRRDVDAPGGGDELRLQDEQGVVAAAGGAVADRALPRQLRHFALFEGAFEGAASRVCGWGLLAGGREMQISGFCGTSSQ